MLTRLRTQYLFFFVLAAVLPVLVLGIVELSLFRRMSSGREAAVLQDNLQLADLMSSNLRYELNLVLEPTQKAAGTVPDLLQLPPPEQDAALARAMSTTSLFRHLLLVDGRGRVLASARPTLWRNQQLPAAVFPARASIRPVHYSPVFGSIYDAASLAAIAYAYPRFERAALVSLLDLSTIEAQISAQSGPRRQVRVVDQTGRVLGQRVRGATDFSRLAPVQAVLRGERGTARFREPGGEAVQLGAYAPVAGTGWGVIVLSDAGEVSRGLFSFESFGIGLLVTTLGSIGFAFWLSERISQPLQNLSVQMQAIAGGHPPPQPLAATAATALEVQVLIDSFKTMNERIRSETEANQALLASLSAEKTKLELIIEAIAEGVLVYDLEGRIITANRTLWTLIKSEPAAVPDWQSLELRDALGEPVAPRQAVLARAITSGPLSALYRRTAAGGTGRILQITAAPLRSVTGESAGGVAVVRDVTEQKEGERLREDFVATLTHDLRTPLLAAVQTLNFALDGQYGPFSQSQKEIFQAVVESHRELLGLVESLLTIYRYEAGRIELHKQPTELAPFIEQCLGELGALARARNLSLSLESVEDLPTVPVDRQQLRRVVVNLVDNALKFTPVGGKVHLQIKASGAGVEVAVHDSGRGILPARQAHLFTRFTQEGSYGTGLGLYLCRQIVEAHGGQIWADSKPGLGSTFYFTLPVSAL